MAEVFRVQAKDTLIRFGNYDVLNAVQNFSWDPSFNEEYLEELGNAAYAGYSATPEVSGSFDMTATGATVSILKRMIAKYNSGTGAFEGFMAGAPSTANNAGRIIPTDLRNAQFDLLELKSTSEALHRTTVFPRCFLSGMSFGADVNGNATESYQWEGILGEVYKGIYRSVVVTPVEWVDADTVSIINDAGYTDYDLAQYTLLYLLAGDKKILAANLTVVPGTPDTINLTGGNTITIDQRLMLVMHLTTPANTMPTITYPTTARFVKADKVSLWMVKKSDIDLSTFKTAGDLNAQAFTSAQQLLRVQSFDANVDMRMETLRQLAQNTDGVAIYHREPTYPLNVTASVTMLERELQDWARFAGQTDKLTVAGLVDQEWQLVVRYFVGATVVQTMAFLDMKISGRSASVGVGGSAEESWSLTGSDFVIYGAAV